MIPYPIYDDCSGLGSKVGFIFGGCMVVALVFTFFCVPACKGKTLEEVDHLFRLKVPIRQLGTFDLSTLRPIEGTRPSNKGAVRLNQIEIEAGRRRDTDEEKGAAKQEIGSLNPATWRVEDKDTSFQGGRDLDKPRLVSREVMRFYRSW